ncbi:unnamed protein product [Arabis nemorensis]|uniref:Reverse transcriptase zinc-binding domain-containing protein n=1 Tax=Arabis nemorensis TaxID=586526 RepID=A0A565BK84_9BRAS|nr:unnamed protein product [Arabis nemorensis]
MPAASPTIAYLSPQISTLDSTNTTSTDIASLLATSHKSSSLQVPPSLLDHIPFSPPPLQSIPPSRNQPTSDATTDKDEIIATAQRILRARDGSDPSDQQHTRHLGQHCHRASQNLNRCHLRAVVHLHFVPAGEADYRPLMGVLFETHIKKESGSTFINRLLPNWRSEDNFIANESVVTYHKSDRMIVCGVFVPQLQHYFTVSFIYAFNCHIKCRLLWQELADLRDSSPTSSRPWILVGDFNQILSQHEHSSIPQTLAPTNGMQEMRSCFEYLDIQDISARGALYTWKNNCHENPTLRKLDKVMINEAWSTYFPSSVAFFDPPGSSDHSPCVINLGFDVPSTKKPFKFYRHVMTHPDYLLLLDEAWSMLGLFGTAQFILSKKMVSAKNCLKLLNRRHYSNIQQRVKASFSSLQAIQAQLLLTPSQHLIDQESEARRTYAIYSNAEEQFFHQRSRIQWLSEEMEMIGKSLTRHSTSSWLFNTSKTYWEQQTRSSIRLQWKPLALSILFDTLDEFHVISGLALNKHKTSLFLSGNDHQRTTAIAANHGLSPDFLPVRYLGLPLHSTKLDKDDFQMLYDRISRKLSAWSNKFLSYAGRLQLIKYVIYGHLNFWFTAFPFPKAFLVKLEALISSFLWHGKPGTAHGAKVSWDAVSKPIKHGGLRLRKLSTWNEIFGLKLIWLIFTKSGSLWYTGPSGPLLLGIPSDSRVAHAAFDEEWCFVSSRASRRRNLRNAISLLSPLTNTATEDTFFWSTNYDQPLLFTTTYTWLALNDFGPMVSWHSSVWFTGNILKHAFITWLFVLNRLTTRDRLHNWGVTTDCSCLLCSASIETCSHLFFSCSFSQDIWSVFSPSYHLFPLAFDSIMHWIPSLPRRISKTVKLTFQACVYAIWRERNSRLFGSSSRTSSSIVAEVSRTIRNPLYIMDQPNVRSRLPQTEDSNMVLWFRHFHPSNLTFQPSSPRSTLLLYLLF